MLKGQTVSPPAWESEPAASKQNDNSSKNSFVTPKSRAQVKVASSTPNDFYKYLSDTSITSDVSFEEEASKAKSNSKFKTPNDLLNSEEVLHTDNSHTNLTNSQKETEFKSGTPLNKKDNSKSNSHTCSTAGPTHTAKQPAQKIAPNELLNYTMTKNKYWKKII